MELEKLRIGRRYWVTHKRKGIFNAVVVGFEEGDERDPFLIRMDMDTSDSGAPLLRRVKLANVTRTDIRPSLIIRMDPYEPRVKPEPPKEVESLGDRLKRALGFRR